MWYDKNAVLTGRIIWQKYSMTQIFRHVHKTYMRYTNKVWYNFFGMWTKNMLHEYSTTPYISVCCKKSICVMFHSPVRLRPTETQLSWLQQSKMRHTNEDKIERIIRPNTAFSTSETLEFGQRIITRNILLPLCSWWAINAELAGWLKFQLKNTKKLKRNVIRKFRVNYQKYSKNFQD